MKLKLEGEKRLYFGFLEAFNMIKRYEKRRIKDAKYKITPRMLTYISLVESYPDISQKDLLTFLDISKGTLSNMALLLEKKKIVVRVQDAHDRRKMHLHLTKIGKDIARLNIDIRAQIEKYIKSKITEEEFLEFQRIALKMRSI